MRKIAILEIVAILIGLIIISSANADNYAQGADIDLINICRNDGALCSDGSCNKTVLFPNGSVLVDNFNMTRSGATFNYTLHNSDTLGEYTEITTCCDGSNCETSEENFFITYGGYEDIDSLTIIIAAGIMSLLLILLALFTTEPGLYIFKITFSVFALLIVLLVIPSAMLSEAVAFTLFKWGGIVSYLFGILIIIYIMYLLWIKFVKMMFGAKKNDQEIR